MIIFHVYDEKMEYKHFEEKTQNILEAPTFLNLTWHVDEGTLNIFSFFAFRKYEVFHIQR